MLTALSLSKGKKMLNQLRGRFFGATQTPRQAGPYGGNRRHSARRTQTKWEAERDGAVGATQT